MPTRHFSELAIPDSKDLLFGRAPYPLTCGHDLVIGDGVVHPEINFTLPPMEVKAATMPAIVEQYERIIHGVCERSVDLEAPGLVVEFELLPPMTEHPEWGEEIVALLHRALEGFHQKHGLKSALTSHAHRRA